MNGKKVSKLVAAMLLASLVPFGVNEAKADENVDPSQISKQEQSPQETSETKEDSKPSESKEEAKPSENSNTSEELVVADPKLNQIMEKAKFTEDELKTKEDREKVIDRINNSKKDLKKEEENLQKDLDEIKKQNETDITKLDKAYELKRKEMLIEYQIKTIDDTLAGSKEITPEEFADPKIGALKRSAKEQYEEKSLEIFMKSEKIEKELDDLLTNRAVRENQPKIGEEVKDEKDKLWNEMQELSKKAEPIEEKANYYEKRYSQPFYKASSELEDKTFEYHKAITDMADDLRKQGIDPETDPKYMELYKTNSKVSAELSDESFINHMLGYKHFRVYCEMRKDAVSLMNKYFIKSRDSLINEVELEAYKEFKEGKITAENIDSLIEAEPTGTKKRLYERYKDYFENGNKESDAADREYEEIIKKRDEYKQTLDKLKEEEEKLSEEQYERYRPIAFLHRMWHEDKSKDQVTKDLNNEKADLENRLKATKEESSQYNIDDLEKGLKEINKLISDKEKEISYIGSLADRLQKDIDSINKINPTIEDKVDESENTNKNSNFISEDLYNNDDSLNVKSYIEDDEIDDEIRRFLKEIDKLNKKNEEWMRKRRVLTKLERAYMSSKSMITIAEKYLNSDKIIAANRDRLIKLIAKQKEINKKAEKYIKNLRVELYKEAIA